MSKRRTEVLYVQGTEVSVINHNEDDYVSLTDMAKMKNSEIPGTVISHWMTTNFTMNFMGVWEKMHNPNFNLTGFREVKMMSTETGFALSPKQWIQRTNAMGLVSRSGRYGGGTFAHRHIAFEFASWLSPEFKYYLISEFERLKENEQKNLSAEWSLQRTLAKVNYRIHTDAIREQIIPGKISKEQASRIYASEADLLNVALFGKTAAEWRALSSNKGNIRDEATLEQLVVLSNLESINAVLIREGLPQKERKTPSAQSYRNNSIDLTAG